MQEQLENLELMELLERQRSFFRSGKTLSIRYRLEHLERLSAALMEQEQEILGALEQDLGKPSFESYETELGMVRAEISCARKHLRSWAGTEKRKTPLAHFPAKSRVYKEPLGVVLILAPWNYPLQLTLSPLVSALCAGNCAIIKPSRYAPRTAEVVERVIARAFPPEYVAVVQGGGEVNRRLLELRFDHILFTGSTAVGREVMAAAAKHLTPVTLELGGKSPCIVEESANIELAARRIAWGKCINAGQTCVAPDYVLVDRRHAKKLVDRLEKYLRAFYGALPLMNPDYPRIVNEKHFDRLLGLMEEEQAVFGGGSDREALKIEPTILLNVDTASPVMKEEIFGPLLPVIPYDRLDEALDFVKSGEKPLALYLFTRDRKVERKVLRTVSFGGGCVNDTIVHLANPHMGFGGVGESGMGAYHGKKGFDTFSHEKSVLKKSNRLDLPFRYPPYRIGTGILKLFLK